MTTRRKAELERKSLEKQHVLEGANVQMARVGQHLQVTSAENGPELGPFALILHNALVFVLVSVLLKCRLALSLAALDNTLPGGSHDNGYARVRARARAKPAQELC